MTMTNFNFYSKRWHREVHKKQTSWSTIWRNNSIVWCSSWQIWRSASKITCIYRAVLWGILTNLRPKFSPIFPIQNCIFFSQSNCQSFPTWVSVNAKNWNRGQKTSIYSFQLAVTSEMLHLCTNILRNNTIFLCSDLFTISCNLFSKTMLCSQL